MKINYSSSQTEYNLTSDYVKYTPGVYITEKCDYKFISVGNNTVLFHDEKSRILEVCDWNCWEDHKFTRTYDISITITF